VARSYAHAFLDAAPPEHPVDRFLEGAGAVERAISAEGPLRAFLTAPNVPADAKASALEEIGKRAGLDEFGRRFFGVVLHNRRILALAEILAGISEAFDVKQGVVAARVTVAAPIEEPERARIELAIGKRTGRKVRMRLEVDPEVLGGFVARVGSEVFDASIATAIESFRTGGREKAGS
jgi:F-type H+-transporting ATPase subunit delta